MCYSCGMISLFTIPGTKHIFCYNKDQYHQTVFVVLFPGATINVHRTVLFSGVKCVLLTVSLSLYHHFRSLSACVHLFTILNLVGN